MATPKITQVALAQFEDHLAKHHMGVEKIARMFESVGIPAPMVQPGPNVRRRQIRACYDSLDLSQWADVKKLLNFFECVLLNLANEGSPESEQKYKHLIRVVQREGYNYTNDRFVLPDLRHQESVAAESKKQDSNGDRFIDEFPAGLPFGKSKPLLDVGLRGGRAVPCFEASSDNYILKSGVYPDLDFAKLSTLVYGNCDKGQISRMRAAISGIIDTEHERKFLNSYNETFAMVRAHVPALVPQAWIQWHSSTKKNLRAQGSAHADRLLRVDFVAFWGNRRFAILVDDISHYAFRRGKDWIASAEIYSKRLKEDRCLRKEKWEVFRVSNWEMSCDAVGDTLQDFRELVGF